MLFERRLAEKRQNSLFQIFTQVWISKLKKQLLKPAPISSLHEEHLFLRLASNLNLHNYKLFINVCCHSICKKKISSKFQWICDVNVCPFVNKFTNTKSLNCFQPGDFIKTIEIKIIDDEIFEDDEFFSVHLSNMVNSNRPLSSSSRVKTPDTKKIFFFDLLPSKMGKKMFEISEK